jgi:hypothetical protein
MSGSRKFTYGRLNVEIVIDRVIFNHKGLTLIEYNELSNHHIILICIGLTSEGQEIDEKNFILYTTKDGLSHQLHQRYHTRSIWIYLGGLLIKD